MELSFETKIRKTARGSYRIWLPKKISCCIPEEDWFVDSVYIEGRGHKQIYRKCPLSKGADMRYISISKKIARACYEEFGPVRIVLNF